MDNQHLMHTYARLPVAFARGEGARLWDSEGREYLDALGGIAVAVLGHAHPDVTRAACEQAGLLMHTSNLFEIPLQAALGERLCAVAGMDRAFFCNSGAEANEAAIKLARRYGNERGVTGPAVVVTEGSFHGRTLATLSATGNRKVQAGFEPLVSGFRRVRYDDLESVRQVARNDPTAVAVLVEPIQGEGGIVVPDPGYLAGLRAICDEQGWLLMVDEIQTGMCRTGHWFAFEHAGIRPDVVTLAKGLGNGFPVGACLARGAAAEVLAPGSHGTTFGGNPLASRVALAVLDVLQREDLATRAGELGTRMREQLASRLGDHPAVRSVRGRGLMIGIELDRPCGELVTAALAKGLVLNVTAGSVIRLLPPLVMDDAQAARVVDLVCELVDGFGAAP